MTVTIYFLDYYNEYVSNISIKMKSFNNLTNHIISLGIKPEKIVKIEF